MKKSWLMKMSVMLAALCCVSAAYAQPVTVDDYRTEAETYRANALEFLSITNTNIEATAQSKLQTLLNEAMNPAPPKQISTADYNNCLTVQNYCMVTMGITTDPFAMCDEWGYDPSDPMVIMMLQGAQGPWQHESLYAKVYRQWAKGNSYYADAYYQDELNLMYVDMCAYARQIKADAIASGVDPSMLMSYDMMIQCADNALIGGYAESTHLWAKASDMYLKCCSSTAILQQYFNLVTEIRDK